MEILSDPHAWTAFLTLTALETVLGIDNIIFIAILTEKLPEPQQPLARRLGLGAAMLMRIGLLVSMAAQSRVRALVLRRPGLTAAAWGAVLFLASDANLAINKFRLPFEAAPVVILGTYWIGQWLIARSVEVRTARGPG